MLMDGDLQDPPELIPRLLEEWRAGAHVVYATKRTRAERGLRRLGFELFHRLFRGMGDIALPLQPAPLARRPSGARRHQPASRAQSLSPRDQVLGRIPSGGGAVRP